jgi:hypothetical protein
MQQVADWLKELGMAQYTQAFADNDSDFAVLRHLTDQHLKGPRCFPWPSAEDAPSDPRSRERFSCRNGTQGTHGDRAKSARRCRAEVHRIAGEIALKSPAPDTEKAQKHFERALSAARLRQMKSFELRAATSLARFWRDQGKVQQARIACSGLRVVHGGV